MDYSECDYVKELKYHWEIPELMTDINVAAIAFSEELTLFGETFKTVGFIKSIIQQSNDCLLTVEYRSESFEEYVPPIRDKFYDDSSSTSSKMGYSCKLSVSSLIDPCLLAYRERYLWSQEQYYRSEESISYLVKIGNNYYIDQKINGTVKDNSYTKLSCCQMKNVISRSADLLLLRIIALKNYRGRFKAFVFDFEGTLHPCVYTVGPSCVKYFRKQKVELLKISKEIQYAKKKHVTHTIITTKDARIVKMWWNYSKYTAAADPKYFLQEFHRCDRPISIDILKNCPKIDQIFIDKVKNNVSNYKKYFDDHPEIMGVLNRFLKELLLRKPENLLNFTLIFFSKLQRIVDKYP